MKIEPIEFTLKDGKAAILRSPEASDAAEMLDYLLKTSGETEFLLRYPEECTKYTLDGEKEFLDGIAASENQTMILCTVDGRLVGNCMISWTTAIKTRHRAEVAIAILQEFWGLGIGTAMFREMIRIAEANPQIVQMELDYIEGNSRARALYEKMGFRISGIRYRATRLKDGSFRNEYSMIREIDR